MTADIEHCVQKVENLQQQLSLKCNNTKELMQKSRASKRSNMRQLRVLAQDITEMVTEMLDVNDAKKILFELLQDLGWEEGQSIQQDMTMSLFDQTVMADTTMMTAATTQGRVPAALQENRLFASELQKEMGVGSPDLLTDEEKKGLEDSKTTDLDTSMNAFARQLTKVKQDLQQNRGVVANFFKEVEEFHEAHSNLINEEMSSMKDLGQLRIQAQLNNHMLDTGHCAFQLSHAQVWSNFTIPDPMQLEQVGNDGSFVLTTHDSQDSCSLYKVDPKIGFFGKEKICSENHKVFATCILNNGVEGISMKADQATEGQTSQVMLLGCNRGYLLKFEKAQGEAEWRKTGECRLGQSVTDVLQIHPMTVVAVQDEGTFDVVDVTSMNSIAHTPTLPGIGKSYKTRMTQRSGGLAIADANGFFFATMSADNSSNTLIKLCEESFLKGNAVNDFLEYKRDTYFVSVLEANYFAIVERPSSTGMFTTGGKTTKIRSISGNYLSMGMSLVPGPRLNQAVILVRDRRGIQLVNLKKGTSHQLMLSAVPVQYTDLRFMEVIYDAREHKTYLVTLFYEDYPAHVKNGLNVAAQADREGNKPLMAFYCLNREFQSGLISMITNSTQDRTLY